MNSQNGEQQNLKTNRKPMNRLWVFGENEDGVQTQDTRDKQPLKSKMKTNQWSRWSTSTDAPSSCNRGGRRPALKNEGSVPTRLADHTLLLQCRQYLEARDLRRTKYGCCSNSTITCYNRRF